jgi:hypothetical protein
MQNLIAQFYVFFGGCGGVTNWKSEIMFYIDDERVA